MSLTINLMPINLPSAWLKALSSLSINLSAAWFATLLVLPQFSPSSASILQLTINFLYGMVFLTLSVNLEKQLEHHERK